MELFVAVASTRRNQIPDVFAVEEDGIIFAMRYEIDPDDGEIYGRQELLCTRENFLESLRMNKVQAFVYNDIDKELADMLAQTDIKLYPGRTGHAAEAAVALVK